MIYDRKKVFFVCFWEKRKEKNTMGIKRGQQMFKVRRVLLSNVLCTEKHMVGWTMKLL